MEDVDVDASQPPEPLRLEAERRLDELGREAFERAVSLAAAQATQNVAAIHRKRLVSQSAVASFIVALCVALAVALVIKSVVEDANRSNALGNCRLIRDISQPLAGFVQSDADLRRLQLNLAIRDEKVTGAYQRLLGRSEYALLVRESENLDRRATTYWTTKVAPRLRSAASADCPARIR